MLDIGPTIYDAVYLFRKKEGDRGIFEYGFDYNGKISRQWMHSFYGMMRRLVRNDGERHS